jgi:hypothetical protein
LSPTWATTGTDKYSNYICQVSKSTSSESYIKEGWNSSTDISETFKDMTAASSFVASSMTPAMTQFTLPSGEDSKLKMEWDSVKKGRFYCYMPVIIGGE